MSRLCVAALAAVLAIGSAVSAEVRLERRADGSLYLYNVGEKRARSVGLAHREASVDRRKELEALADRLAVGSALEPRLVRAVIQVESAFDPRARSRKGAMGLMQLMPATASVYSVRDPYDPEQNVGAGTRYLKKLIDSMGGLELGLAAYNAGPGAVERFGGVPPFPETRNYVEKVMRLYKGDSRYSLTDSKLLRPGRKTYLRRDASGRLLMTTSPPSG